ncbi:bifunctional diguanylate cyclase/phosphodiesterase [Exiguobacterium sp. s166]|uniref:putative bifunctional diguanylate cyclase/phosphodiesterase n=1 Tax=Exiguobacterium sp. s166 TaxID=2751204 RepID=UPI001BECFBD3|nr:bifunctional diguanylate cyclase/phosphodiesterase [Exiguobacterium sp. s166]
MNEWITLTKHYEETLVILSVIVAIVGSYASLELNRRLAKAVSLKKRALFVSSLTMGLSIWGMHFVGMGAFELAVPVKYDWVLMFLSIVPAVTAAWIAFYLLYYSELTRKKVIIAGTLMGMGIAMMHYLGMVAMQFDGDVRYDAALFTLSIVIAITVAYVALLLLYMTRHVDKKRILIPVAILMGFGISTMHYVGMLGTTFCVPGASGVDVSASPVTSNILSDVAVPVFLIVLLIVGLYIHLERRALQMMAYTDHLTGLHNRRWLDHHMAKVDGQYSRTKKRMTMALLDLDGYKWINDTFGFDQGDIVIRQFSDRIKALLQEDEACIRYNGTQFFLIQNIHPDLLEEAFTDVLEAIRQPIFLDGQEIHLTATIGIIVPNITDTLEMRIGQMESALRAGKNEGRDRFVIYDELLHSDRREQQIVGSLRRAMTDFKEFNLVYQPKIALATGKVEQAEVLIRWNHPKFGFISPAEFIPLAEKYSLIHRLTQWVLQETVKQMEVWREEDHFIRQVSVNLSAMHFRSESHNLMIKEIVHHSLKNGGELQLQLEITETSVMENLERALLMLGELKQLSLTIALDDFGTGLSSLTHLKHLPIDILKIDKSFIDEVPHDERGTAITEMIIQLAKSLGIEVVAEGVETLEQHEFLKRLGCDYGQGYYYSRPVKVKDLDQQTIERTVLDVG